MARSPSCFCAEDEEEGFNRGAWTSSEDKILSEYIKTHGVDRWRSLPKKAGLRRRGSSCRLRWLNHLRPDIKRGNICPEEDELLIRLYRLLGNRWALIAGRLPGRTGNEIKNYWNNHLSKRVQMGEFEPKFQKPLKRRDVPSCPNYDEEVVVDKEIYTSQSTPLKTRAVRYCERTLADVENLDSYNYDHVLDTQDGINLEEEEEGLKAEDDHVVEIDISKPWCQLLFEDCMEGYQYDELELIKGLQANSIISSSCGTDEQIFQEKHSSSSCNIVDRAFPHSEHFNSTYLESLMEL